MPKSSKKKVKKITTSNQGFIIKGNDNKLEKVSTSNNKMTTRAVTSEEETEIINNQAFIIEGDKSEIKDAHSKDNIYEEISYESEEEVDNEWSEIFSTLQQEFNYLQNFSHEQIDQLKDKIDQLKIAVSEQGKKLSREEIREQIINYTINTQQGHILANNKLGNNTNLSYQLSEALETNIELPAKFN